MYLWYTRFSPGLTVCQFTRFFPDGLPIHAVFSWRSANSRGFSLAWRSANSRGFPLAWRSANSRGFSLAVCQFTRVFPGGLRIHAGFPWPGGLPIHAGFPWRSANSRGFSLAICPNSRGFSLAFCQFTWVFPVGLPIHAVADWA